MTARARPSRGASPGAVFSRAVDVVAWPLDDDLVLVPLTPGVDHLADGLHLLNGSARTVWELLDGRRSLAEIGAELGRHYRTTLVDEVVAMADELVGLGFAGAGRPGPPPATGDIARSPSIIAAADRSGRAAPSPLPAFIGLPPELRLMAAAFRLWGAGAAVALPALTAAAGFAAGPRGEADARRAWRALPATAAGHGLARLTDLALRTGDLGLSDDAPAWSSVPEAHAASAALALESRAVALRGLAMIRRLAIVQSELERRGLAAVAVKGPVTAVRAYGDPLARRFGDLDLVVAPEQVSDVVLALREAGFEGAAGPAGVFTETQLGAEQETALFNAGADLVIEIHWRFGHRFASGAIPAADLLARATPVALLGRAVTVAGASVCDSVLIAAIHGTNHSWGRLEDVTAFAGCLAGCDRATWDEVQTLARQYGCARRVRLAIRLAAGLLDVHPPGGGALAAARGRERTATILAARALRCLAGGDEAAGRWERLTAALAQAAAMDSSSAALAHAAGRLGTPGVHDLAPGEGAGESGWRRQLRRQRRLWRR